MRTHTGYLNFLVLNITFILAIVLTPLNVDAQVTEEWLKLYDGPGSGYDHGRDLTIDDSGNIYVTGRSRDPVTGEDFVTLKYDNAGNELWVSRYVGPADSADMPKKVFVDEARNVYVAGSSFGTDVFDDYLTMKYNSVGTEQWVQRYNDPPVNVDTLYDMTGDPAGNIYVTGFSVGSITYKDGATIKYDRDGTELWVARYNGPFNRHDELRAITLDDAGNVYVTGYTFNGSTTGKEDYVTIKYNRNGLEYWAVQYRGPGNDTDIPSDIAVDSAGNVYITGSTTGVGTEMDFTTIKYDSSGRELWVAQYDYLNTKYEQPEALAIDDDGNVYVTGNSHSDFVTIKYDQFGNEIWVQRVGLGNSAGRAIDIDFAGNIYVAGYTKPVSEIDFTVIKYDPDGTMLWFYTYDGPDHGDDSASDILVDSDLNIYVTGGSYSAISDGDIVTIKLSQTPEVPAVSTIYCILLSAIPVFLVYLLNISVYFRWKTNRTL